jgi:hypothetical protein
MKIKKILLTAFTAALVVSPTAEASDAKYMAGFYVAIKAIQVTALSGTADMWKALGHAQKAQETLGIAKDLEKGDLGPEVAQNAMKVASAEVQAQIEQLEAVGAPLTKEQRAAATSAYLKIAGTTVLWVGALAAAKKSLESDEIDGMTKLTVGLAMAGEVAEAGGATNQLLQAWRAYSQFNSGLRGLKAPSKELMKEAPLLASL